MTRISDEFNPNLFLWLQTAQRLKLSDTVNVNNARCGFTHKYLLLVFRSFFFFFLSNPLWLSSTRRFRVLELSQLTKLTSVKLASWSCSAYYQLHNELHRHFSVAFVSVVSTCTRIHTLTGLFFFSCTPSSCLISDARAYLMMWIETTVPWCYGFCSMWRTEMMIINVIVAETLFDLEHGSHSHRVS